MKEKLGMRASHTAEVRLVKCRVAEDSLLGKEGAGFEQAKQLLDSSRIVMGMICVGIARAAYVKALAYAKGRDLFGKKLSDMQLTREKVANAAIEIERLAPPLHARREAEGAREARTPPRPPRGRCSQQRWPRGRATPRSSSSGVTGTRATTSTGTGGTRGSSR